MILFKRFYSLQIDDLLIEGLRVVFSIEKDKSSSQNKARIEIYNLSETTRSKIKNKDLKVILKVGYEKKENLENIFIGDISAIHIAFKPPEIITIIECGSGYKTLREAKSIISNGAGIAFKSVVNSLVKSLDVTIKEISTGDSKDFTNGFSFIGSTKKALDSLSENFELDWSIDDDGFSMVPKNESKKDKQVLIDSESGLLGTPEPVVSDSDIFSKIDKKKPKYKIDTLMNPKLSPKNKIALKSLSGIDGDFIVNSVNHRGDTHGDDWISISEVQEI